MHCYMIRSLGAVLPTLHQIMVLGGSEVYFYVVSDVYSKVSSEVYIFKVDF